MGALSTNFQPSLRLTDLKFAAGFSIWGFRAFATGHQNCPGVVTGFTEIFGPRTPFAAQYLNEFIQTLATAGSKNGRRVIKLSRPGCLSVTTDEISILSALYHAQTDESDLVKSHLQWLSGSSDVHLVYHAVMSFACIMIEAGLFIDERDTQIKPMKTDIKDLVRKGQNVRSLH